MSNTVIALLISVGAATYLYNRFMNTTGGNSKSAITIALTASALLFVFLLFILSLIPN